MGLAAGVAIAGLLVSGASAVASAGAQKTAANIAAGEAEVAAQQTELEAVQKEADRKSRLAQALASQNAAAGAKGLAAFEGSPLTVIEADIKAEEEATQRGKFGSELTAFTQRTSGQSRSKIMKRQASAGLLGDVGKIAVSAGSQFATQ